MKILLALLRKELIMMRHNPIIPRVALLMPLAVMLILPLVANMDVKNVNVAVVDNDRSQLSRQIIADANASDAINIVDIYGTHNQGMEAIEVGKADVLMTIPPEYSRQFPAGTAQIDIEANGVNATKGVLGARYLSESVMQTLMENIGDNTDASAISVVNRYNPTLNFRNYMIPALMVVLIIIICGFIPALNLVDEKETGTIEAMNVTPVSRMTFVMSKLIPLWIVGLIVVTVGILVGWWVYGLVPVGNIAAIYLATVIFSLVMSGLGVIIANKSATMLQSIFVMFAVIIIFQLMSGLYTPISSMPGWAQTITYALPPRYFIEIMRSLYLKGASVADLYWQYLALSGMAVLMLTLAAVTYRKRS